MWMRGLKHVTGKFTKKFFTSHPMWMRGLKLRIYLLSLLIGKSHPMWMRGLKLKQQILGTKYAEVAPHVDAWIETHISSFSCKNTISRTPCGCVDWNYCPISWQHRKMSRTPCGCVDWNNHSFESSTTLRCRTPCGCVDWNYYYLPVPWLWKVAPHVDAWIETIDMPREMRSYLVAPHVDAWIETLIVIVLSITFFMSHPMWMRGLKPF